MSNHVHLLLTPMTNNGISLMMQALGRRYVYYFNKSYERSGTLWEGRYKSSLIDSDAYLLTCMRYIEMNPVRAKLVEHPGAYPWSSYVANAHGDTNELIEPHPLYLDLDTTKEARLSAYRELFRAHMEEDILHDIRDSLNQELVLGRSEFKDKIEEVTERQTRLRMPGRPKVEEEPARYYVYKDSLFPS